MLNMVAPYHTKLSICNSLGLVLAIDPSPMGNFIHYDFQILHYIYHKMKYVSLLRVAVLACNIMLHTLPKQHIHEQTITAILILGNNI